MATPNYTVDYNDKRFTEVENDKKTALNEIDTTYGNMIGDADKYFQDQMDAADSYAETQAKNQQEQTDFAIERIEQQKDQTKKDYIKEQSGAYVDWQQQINPYGANAERMAASGLANSGYSESSLVSMYNTYQNRVATARDVYNRAVLDFDNQITEARLQNNSILAEIAYQALQKRLELGLQGFQYKNQLIIDKMNKKIEVDNMYYSRWKDVLTQINSENAMAEQIRQYNEKMALERSQLKLQQDQFAWQKEQAKLANQKKIAKPSGEVTDGGKADTTKTPSGKKTITVSGGGTSKKTASKTNTYNKAADTMKKAGAIKAGDGGLMTKTEWKRRKASGSNRAETSYATYEDYLNSFTAWRIANPEK